MIPCPSCGRTNENHYRFCLGCGTPLSGAHGLDGVAASSAGAASHRGPEPTSVGRPRPAPGLAADAYSPTVAVPSQPVAAGASATPATGPHITPRPLPAGPAVSAPPAPRRCQQCQGLVPDGFTFCGRCGARWTEPSTAETSSLARSLAPAETRTIGRLVVLRPDGSAGDALPLREGPNTLGRSGTLAFPADRLLSPRHATLYTREGRLFVRDEQSLNGVFVRLVGEAPLDSGAVFRIGQQLLRYDDKRDVELLQPPAAGDDSHVLGSPDLGAWGRLVQLLTPARAGNVFLLSGAEVTLGRERAHITFPHDGFVSGTHAALLRDGERTRLADRGSSNGTYVRIRGDAPLAHGSLLLAGQNLLRVELA